MVAKYLVLNKEFLRQVLTKSEFDVLQIIVNKVNRLEGRKLYNVEEIK